MAFNNAINANSAGFQSLSSTGTWNGRSFVAGTGITISNPDGIAGAPTFNVIGGGFNWSDKAADFTAAFSNGYFVTGTTKGTLPGAPSEGDTIIFVVDDTNILTIQATGSQKIRIGTALSAAAGTAANNSRGDSVTLTYRTVGTTWIASNVIGIWTVT